MERVSESIDRPGDLHNPRALYAKGALFLILGGLSGALLLLQHFSWTTAALLVLSIWSFCRCYYFAFYVIEHYVDRGYRFAGLIDFTKYLLRKNQQRRQP